MEKSLRNSFSVLMIRSLCILSAFILASCTDSLVWPTSNKKLEVNLSLIEEVTRMVPGSPEQRLAFDKILSQHEKYYIVASKLQAYISSPSLSKAQRELMVLAKDKFSPEVFGMELKGEKNVKTKEAVAFVEFLKNEWTPKAMALFNESQLDEVKNVIANVSSQDIYGKVALNKLHSGFRTEDPNDPKVKCQCNNGSICSCTTNVECATACNTGGTSAGCGCFLAFGCDGSCSNPVPE